MFLPADANKPLVREAIRGQEFDGMKYWMFYLIEGVPRDVLKKKQILFDQWLPNGNFAINQKIPFEFRSNRSLLEPETFADCSFVIDSFCNVGLSN